MAGFADLDACLSVMESMAKKLNIPLQPMAPSIPTYSPSGIQTAESDFTAIQQPPPVKMPAYEEVKEETIDMNDLDIYQLRMKYAGAESVPAWEQAAADPENNKIVGVNGQGSEADLLFMKGISTLSASGPDSMPALMAMERLPQNSVYRFLPYYLALDQGVSRSHITELVRTGSGNVSTSGKYLIDCSIQMINAALLVVKDMEEQMASGHHNRQEAFQRASNRIQKQTDLWKLLT